MKKFNIKNLMIWLFAMFFSLSSFGQVIIGTGTSESNPLPIEAYYGYSYSQSIYLASEIGGAGTIGTIAYQYDGYSQLTDSDSITIYIGHTTKTSFTSTSDWVASTAMTQVYNASLPTFTSGSGAVWITFDITDFAYNGTDNLVIAFDENTPSYGSSDDDFFTTAVTGNRSICFYDDDVNPDPTAPNATPPVWGTIALYDDIPNLKIGFIVPDYSLDLFTSAQQLCGQSFIDITLEYTNTGFSQGDTLNFTYVEQYSSTTVNEQVIVNIAPGVTDQFTFTTPFAINPSLDSNYCFTAWVTMGANGDSYSANDSILSAYCVHNGVSLPVFTTIGTTVPYATTGILVADTNGTGLGVIKWYTDSTATTEIFVGDSLETPILYNTTTFWAEGMMGTPNVKITEVSHFSGSTGAGPTPVWLTTNSDFTEITNLGPVDADVSGWIFHRRAYNIDYTIPAGATIPSGETMILMTYGGSANAAYNVYVASTATDMQSSYAAGYWLENTSSDIIDVVALNSYDIVSNSGGVLTSADWSGNVASSSGNAGITRIASDNNTAADWNTSSVTALNSGTMNLSLSVYSSASSTCPTPRIPVIATVNNIPLADAGVVEIINPINGFDITMLQNIEVVITNYTATPLLNANIICEINGVQSTYPYINMSGLAQGDLDTVIVNSFIFTNTINNFVAYTTMPNGIADLYNFNDTVTYFANACFTGEITIGSTPGNDFQTINDALNALNNSSLCGHTTFLLDAETFAEQVVVTPIIGSGSNATLTFKGQGDASKIETTGVSTDKTIFSIRGAEYITLDSIFIEGTGTYCWALHLSDNANHINIVNSHIKVPYSTSSNILPITTGTLSSYTSYANHVNDLTLSNNIIEGGYRSINIYGTSSSNRIKNIAINNNDIGNSYQYVTYIRYADSLEINNNNITNTTSYFRGLYLYYCEQTNITHNNITGYGTSTHYGMYLSQCNTGNSSFRGQLSNNNIIFDKSSTYSGTTYAMYITGSDYFDVVNNTVIIGENYTSTSSRCLYLTSTEDSRIINNNFVNQGRGYAMYHGSTSASYLPIQCDNNNYYCPDPAYNNFIYYSGNKTNLAAIQSATTFDDNSLEVDPYFASSLDGHIMSSDLDSAALPWPSVIYDMDMDMRDATYPDIGADEFDYRTKDLAANMITSPVSPLFIGQNVYPTVEVQSMGADTVYSYDISYQIDNGPIITESNTTSLAFYDTEYYTFNTGGVYAPAVPFLLTAWVSNVTGDIELSNDTISTMVTVIPPNEDAGIAATYAPTAIVYQVGQVVYPSIELMNYGINPLDTCDISYKFNDGYMVTETFYGNLAQTQSTTFTFTTGYPVQLTSTDFIMYTSLAGDIVNYNDTSKVSFSTILPPHDAGVSDIINPGTSAFFNGTTIIPEVEITNYGTNAQTSIDITYISGMNTVTETWTGNLASGATMNYVFNQGFVYDFMYPNIKAYSTLANDILWSNDTTSRPIFYSIIGNDVGVTSVDDPSVNTYVGQNVYPTVTIFNEGHITQNAIDVTYVVNGGTPVTETWTGAVTYQTSTTYTFNTPFVAPSGTYDLCVFTTLSNDTLINNDTACTTITSIPPTIDVGVSAISAPGASSPMYQEVFPSITIENFATTAQTSIDVSYAINNSATVTETWTGTLAAGATTTYTFTQGFITPLVDFNFCAYTGLATDQVEPNDTMCMLVTADAALDDVGISAIIEPTTTVYIGQTIMPIVTIENFGSNTQTSLDVTYIHNGVAVTETWTGSLAMGATDNYTFTQGFDVDATNIDICAHTNLSLDVVNTNDTICMATIMPMTPANDVGISTIVTPRAIDIVSNYNIVSVWIRNYGTSIQTSIPVAYQIDALTPVQETWTGTLNPNDSVLFNFATQFTSSVDYQFCAITNLTSDQVNENDGICRSVVIGIGETVAYNISLEQNIPNPATNNTLINYNVPNNGTAVLQIRDLQGRLIYTEEGEVLAGSNSFSINTENYASGLYLYTLYFNGTSLSRKMNIQK